MKFYSKFVNLCVSKSRMQSCISNLIKDRVMGPLLVLVSPCFRNNVIVTCNSVSFLCSSHNFLPKNVIVFFWEIKFQNGAYLGKKKTAIFNLLFTYFSHQGKDTKIPSACICCTYFAHPIDFFAFQFCKNYKFIMYGFSLVWLGVDSYWRHFGAINK